MRAITQRGREIWDEGKKRRKETMKKMLDELRTEVGFLFQGSALFDSMTVAENECFLLYHQKLPYFAFLDKKKEEQGVPYNNCLKCHASGHLHSNDVAQNKIKIHVRWQYIPIQPRKNHTPTNQPPKHQ